MKSKKLISLLCAAAVTVSSFAGLAVTASAASDPVYSWDGSTTLGITAGEVGMDRDGSFLQITGESKNQEYKFALPAAAQLTDDYVIDFDTYIKPGNGCGRLGGYTQILFAGTGVDAPNSTTAAPLKDTQNYGTTYADAVNTKYGDENGQFDMVAGDKNAFNNGTDNNGGIGYQNVPVSVTARHELAGNWVLSYAGAAPDLENDGDVQTEGEWVRIRAAVKDGKANYTIKNADGETVSEVEKTVTAEKMTQLVFVVGRGDMNFTSDKLPSTGAAVIQLDNINIYDGVDNAPELNTKGLRKESKAITYGTPEEYAGAAPKLDVPAAAKESKTINFDTDTNASVVMGTDAAPENLSVSNGDMFLSVGYRTTGTDNVTAGAIVDVIGGTKAAKLTGGQYATSGRSSMLHLTDSAIAESGTTVLGFSVYLSKTIASGTPKLWLVDADKDGALTNNSTTAAAYYSGVFGVLTNGTIGSDYKFSSNFNRGIQLTANEWHTVVVAVTKGDKYRIFVDGNYQDPDKSDGILAAVTADTLHYGNTAYTADNLPAIAIENAGGTSAYSTALIDNVITYTVDDINIDNLPAINVVTPVVEVTGYAAATQTLSLNVTNNDELDHDVPVTVVHVSYNSDNTVKSVKSYSNVLLRGEDETIKGDVVIPAEDTVFKGDKFMVWNTLDGMKPLMAVPYAVTEGTEKPVEYRVTVAETANGDVSVDKTTAAAGETITITATPADITDGAGYEVDTVKVMNGTSEVATTTTADGKYTFTMPAADVTVTVTFKQAAVILPELTGTVTISGTAKVGETITASVESITEGATAKYQWQLAETADGEYTDVNGATSSSKKLSAVSLNKYLRVVVTADNFNGQIVSNVLGPVAAAEVPVTKYQITKVVDPADTATVTTTIGDGTEVTEVTDGINVTVNAVPAEGYKISEITVKDADEGDVTFNTESNTFLMPAKNVTVTVKTSAPVASYDFDNSAEGFEATSRITREIVDDDTTGTANGTKVLKFTNAANAGNGMALAKLNFADNVQNATSVTVEFDTYSAGSGRTNFSLFDGNIRGFDGTTFTKGGFNKTGVLFAQGSDATDAYKVRNDNKEIPYGEWVHTVVEIDYATQKINYTVTKAGGETVAAESIAYLDDTAKYATGLELYSWQNNAVAYIDNVKVFAEIGTANTVTINYVDTEGNVIKAAETDAAVNTLPYTVDAAKKATFEANDVRYTYKAEGSTDTITAVSDEAKTITLVFDKVAYETTTFTAKLSAAAKSGVVIKVKGTPAAEGAAAVDTTVTTGDDGTAQIKLLPGTYTYSIDASNDYSAVADTPIVLGSNNEVILEANTAANATLKVVYTTDGAESGKVGETVVYDEDAGKFVGDKIPVSEFTAYATRIKAVADGGLTYKVYDYVSGAPSDEYELASETNTVYLTVSTDDVDYYMYEDFESYDVGTAANAGAVPGFTASATATNIVAGASGQGNVLRLRSNTTWTAANWDTKEAAPITASKVKMEFDMHYGYLVGKEVVWGLNNSDAESIVSVRYDSQACAITKVAIKGVEQDITGIIKVQDSNDYATSNKKAHITVVVDFDTDMAQITFTRDGQSSSYKASIAGLTSENVAAWVHTTNQNNDTRVSTIDNFKVYQTTDTVSAE